MLTSSVHTGSQTSVATERGREAAPASPGSTRPNRPVREAVGEVRPWGFAEGDTTASRRAGGRGGRFPGQQACPPLRGRKGLRLQVTPGAARTVSAELFLLRRECRTSEPTRSTPW